MWHMLLLSLLLFLLLLSNCSFFAVLGEVFDTLTFPASTYGRPPAFAATNHITLTQL